MKNLVVENGSVRFRSSPFSLAGVSTALAIAVVTSLPAISHADENGSQLLASRPIRQSCGGSAATRLGG